MKKGKIYSYTLQFVVLVFVVFLFTACRNSAKFERDINTFFATFFFLIFMIIGGIPSIVFSAISIRSPKSSMRVFAIVFVSIFALFSIISIPLFGEFWRKGTKDWIAFIAIIQYGSLALSLVLIVLGANNKNKIIQNSPSVNNPIQNSKGKNDNSDDEIDYLDEILKD
jgi:glucan phosphoethanolaminetransferase (alkaline phosphatase superfamily)